MVYADDGHHRGHDFFGRVHDSQSRLEIAGAFFTTLDERLN